MFEILESEAMINKGEATVKIIEYDGNHTEEIKLLLVQLQEHLIELDDEDVLIMGDNYKDGYFEFVMKTLGDNNGVMYTAIEDEIVVGLITGVIELPDEEDKIVNCCPVRGYVSEFVIRKEYRKRGIGKQLMKKVEEWFKYRKCDFIRIDVLAQNKETLKFYENNGYKPINIEVSKRI